MAQNYRRAHFEWMRLAEEAVRNSDYEVAARSLRYVSVYFGLVDDSSKRREFAKKAGECFLQAAREFENRKDLPKAVLLCIKAARYYCESGFLFIRVYDLDKAHSMAGRAGTACVKGQIDVILNDHTLLCLLLSKGDLQMAADLWSRIRREFRRSIVESIDSCFEVVKQIQHTIEEG